MFSYVNAPFLLGGDVRRVGHAQPGQMALAVAAGFRMRAAGAGQQPRLGAVVGLRHGVVRGEFFLRQALLARLSLIHI